MLQQVGSYLGYTGRGANPFGNATRDTHQTLVEARPWSQLAKKASMRIGGIA